MTASSERIVAHLNFQPFGKLVNLAPRPCNREGDLSPQQVAMLNNVAA